jgi:hypothetical protein
MHGQGLYNEFGITRPIGYEDCGVGEKFPKPGVGLLTRTGNVPYRFFEKYEVEPFGIVIERGKEWIKYTVLPEDCRGYSTKGIKKIALSGSSFTIDYELENTGTKHIRTNEYCHNFIAVNGSDIDEQYVLRIPCGIIEPASMTENVNPENAAVLGKNSVQFNCSPSLDFFFSPLTAFHENGGEWEITHKGIGVGMRENTDFKPEMMNLWGTKHVISPELFIKIDLGPGQKLSWRRTYSFYYI